MSVYILGTNLTTSVPPGRGGLFRGQALQYRQCFFQKKERVAIYIDGSNTYNRLTTLGVPSKIHRFDFSSFAAHLAGERSLISKRYYVGVVKNFDNSAQGEERSKKQQKFPELRATGFDVKLGTIMYDGSQIREKGVDVKLSVDLVVGAADNLHDAAIVISSDTDLIPAIKYALNGKRKSVKYIRFRRLSLIRIDKTLQFAANFREEGLGRLQNS